MLGASMDFFPKLWTNPATNVIAYRWIVTPE